MIWLQSPPWARWAAALLIAAGAVWIEVKPEPTVLHPFAVVDIVPGTVIDEVNTENRPVPIGTFTPVDLGDTTLRSILSGNPILSSDVGDAHDVVPEGWWAIEVGLPREAARGDSSRLVLLDSGEVVPGVVVTAPVDDPLGSGLGMVAVGPDQAAEVAAAAAQGRVAVMISSS